MVTLWARTPLLPSTVTVPLWGDGGLLACWLLPPPQEIVTIRVTISSNMSSPLQRPFRLRRARVDLARVSRRPAANTKPVSIQPPGCRKRGLTRSIPASGLAVTVNVAVPPGATLLGLTEQVVAVSSDDTLHERVTVWENPASPVTVSVSATGIPRLMVRLWLCAETSKSGFVGPFHAATSAPASTDPSPVVRS